MFDRSLDRVKRPGPANPQSFDLLDRLLEHQCYRLAYWRVAPDEINYRRFFDVNDLAALSMEREDVFEAVHALVLRMACRRQGRRPADRPSRRALRPSPVLPSASRSLRPRVRPTGVRRRRRRRVRRPDVGRARRRGARTAGRPQPRAATSTNRPPPLCRGREDPRRRRVAAPVVGRTRHQRLRLLEPGQRAVRRSSRVRAPHRLYHSIVETTSPFAELVYLKKLLILQVSLSSELHMLTDQLDRLAREARRSRDFTFNTLRQALVEVIACFPVYRSYIDDHGASDADRQSRRAGGPASSRPQPADLSGRVFRFIRDMLLEASPSSFDDGDRSRRRRFAGKFQQVTSPATAKGVEDTAFYVYNRLVSLNEVGGDPGRFGVSPRRCTRITAAVRRGGPVHSRRSRPTTPSGARMSALASTSSPSFRKSGALPSTAGAG